MHDGSAFRSASLQKLMINTRAINNCSIAGAKNGCSNDTSYFRELLLDPHLSLSLSFACAGADVLLMGFAAPSPESFSFQLTYRVCKGRKEDVQMHSNQHAVL